MHPTEVQNATEVGQSLVGDRDRIVTSELSLSMQPIHSESVVTRTHGLNGDTIASSPSQDSLSIWIVVAAYNEGSRLSATLRKLLAAGNFQIVVVDDGSTDDTAAIAREFPVWVLSHPLNCGQGAALRTGIEFALARKAAVVVTFDGDGQHDASEVQRLVNPVLRGECDVTLGTRFHGSSLAIPFSRQCLLKLAIAFTRLTTGLKLTDSHNGFRAFSATAAKTIQIKQPRMAHASEILDQVARKRLRYCEVPVTIRYTRETLDKGQSTFDAAKIGGDLVLGRFVK
ncbi:glycosyltransferase family 2 protein [Rubripirellula amarantea]|nr:glycosyltransferase family 2 protein [Rubripirellula amarantea]